jgi:hypothetical protein
MPIECASGRVSAAFKGELPEPVAIRIEGQLRIERRGVPRFTRYLPFELPRHPTDIAERNQIFSRTDLGRDVVKYLPRGSRRDIGGKGRCFGPSIFTTVQNEKHLGVHWAAREDRNFAGDGFVFFLTDDFKQTHQRLVAGRTIDDDTKAALRTMPDHDDDGAAISWIGHVPRADQQLAHQ